MTPDHPYETDAPTASRAGVWPWRTADFGGELMRLLPANIGQMRIPPDVAKFCRGNPDRW